MGQPLRGALPKKETDACNAGNPNTISHQDQGRDNEQLQEKKTPFPVEHPGDKDAGHDKNLEGFQAVAIGSHFKSHGIPNDHGPLELAHWPIE